MEDVGLQLAAIPAAGIACLWLTSLLRIPAILLLLPVGMLAGPVTGFIEPENLFGEPLFPAVTLAVAVLLFEGGLGLRFDELRGARDVVVRLVSIGTALTFVIGATAAILLFDAPTETALVLGAVLVVSGPTVVGPILALVRPREPVGGVLRWEGITVDPVGATLAIVVVEVVTSDANGVHGALDVALTAVSGIAVGVGFAFGLSLAIRRHLVPDGLQAVVAFGVLLLAFLVAEELLPEGGLFAATALGVALANQRRVTVAHIANFNETLGQVLLAVLFVVLGANVELDALRDVLLPALALAAVLVVVARPLVVAVSTWRSALGARDRAFMAWLAPRGIVAAAVGSVFAGRLADAGIDSTILAPAAFVVILATVALYGLTARPVAKALGVAKPAHRGLALLGAPDWAVELTAQLRARDVPVLVVTTDRAEADAVRAAGGEIFEGRLDLEGLEAAVESAGVRQVLAAGGSEELRELGLERLALLVGRANIFVVPARADGGEQRRGRVETVRARQAFADEVDLSLIGERRSRGWTVATISGDRLDAQDPAVLPLLHIRPDGRVEVVTQRSLASSFSGDLAALVAPEGFGVAEPRG